MKRILKTTLLLILAFHFSCSSDDDLNNEIIEEVPINNKIEFKVNGQNPIHGIRDLSATFCCNNKINVSFNHNLSSSNNSGWGSAFSLSLDKNGNLIRLWYKDYTHSNNEFYSPYFTPTSTLTIENFEFIENQILKFNIRGQIFKQTYDFFAEPESVNIDAEIEIKDFHSCTCNSFSSYLKVNDELVFNSFTRRRIGNEISYYDFSNNGYQIEFKNFNEYITNMPIGIYSFDELSTTYRINFRKYIGVPRAFHIHEVIPQEWLKYETSGSFEILEKNNINGQLVTKVKFNFIAKENGLTVHEINNGIFETQL